MNNYTRIYDIPLLDDIHNYFPALLYDQRHFLTLSDVFVYINNQMDTHFNIYSRAQREYNQANPLRRAPLRTPTNAVIDILPLFTTQQQSTLLSDYFINMLRTPNMNLDPVIISPSQAQIDNATQLRTASNNEGQNCSICQEVYTDGQAIRTINYCSHRFHKNCIDVWFTRNVHCPDCRYDIRT
jgi:hypothetical protein